MRLPGTQQKKAANPRGRRPQSGLDSESLFLDLVHAIAGFGLGGLDLEPVLLGGGGEKSAHAMRLPVRSLHDLGQAGALGPPDQVQDFCALALGARRAGFLGSSGLAGLFTGLGILLGRRLGLATLGGFLALGRALLLGGTLLRGSLLRRNRGALFRNGISGFGGGG